MYQYFMYTVWALVKSFMVLFQHLSQISNSGPLDFESDIRTVTATTKSDNKIKKKKGKKEKQEISSACLLHVYHARKHAVSTVRQVLLNFKEC